MSGSLFKSSIRTKTSEQQMHSEIFMLKTNEKTIQKQPSEAPSCHCSPLYVLALGCLLGSYFIQLLPPHLEIVPALNGASLRCIFMIPKCYLAIQSSNCELLAIRTEGNNKNCKELVITLKNAVRDFSKNIPLIFLGSYLNH